MRRDESRKPFANGLLSIFNRVICKNGKHTELYQLLNGESWSLRTISGILRSRFVPTSDQYPTLLASLNYSPICFLQNKYMNAPFYVRLQGQHNQTNRSCSIKAI